MYNVGAILSNGSNLEILREEIQLDRLNMAMKYLVAFKAILQN
jgi:hypothetical protein